MVNNIRLFHPSVYVAMGFITIGTFTWMYDTRNGVQIPRYKSRYTVFRPNDDFVRLYPKDYITDKHLLSDNHPTTLEDCDDFPRGKPFFDGQLYRKISYTIK